ncbi:hypothetical protein BC567DRAFT_227939 [Phyllosticta citribraziliensis]
MDGAELLNIHVFRVFRIRCSEYHVYLTLRCLLYSTRQVPTGEEGTRRERARIRCGCPPTPFIHCSVRPPLYLTLPFLTHPSIPIYPLPPRRCSGDWRHPSPPRRLEEPVEGERTSGR